MREDRSVIDIPNYYERGTKEWQAVEYIKERAEKELLRFKNKLTKQHLAEMYPQVMLKVEIMEKQLEAQSEMLADFFSGKTPLEVRERWMNPMMSEIAKK